MKKWIAENWFKILTIVLLIIIVVVFSYISTKTNSKKSNFSYFLPYNISGINVLSCELFSTGGIYDKNSSLEPKKEIEEQPLKKDETTIKFTLKDLDKQAVRILIGNSLSIDEAEGLKISENEDYFVIVSFFGLDKSGVQTYTVYKKTGFFTFTRTGNMILIGDSLMYGYGRCF